MSSFVAKFYAGMAGDAKPVARWLTWKSTTNNSAAMLAMMQSQI